MLPEYLDAGHVTGRKAEERRLQLRNEEPGLQITTFNLWLSHIRDKVFLLW